MAERDLHDGDGLGPSSRSRVRRALRGVPGANQRAPSGLAPGIARAQLCRSPPARCLRSIGRFSNMSVGVQRLRDDADRIRQGAIDKGEDPALVDEALAADTRRRELQGEGDALRAERNALSKQIGETIKGGAKPDSDAVAALKARSTEI